MELFVHTQKFMRATMELSKLYAHYVFVLIAHKQKLFTFDRFDNENHVMV